MDKQVSADTDARLHLLKRDGARVQLVLFMLDVGYPRALMGNTQMRATPCESVIVLYCR